MCWLGLASSCELLNWLVESVLCIMGMGVGSSATMGTRGIKFLAVFGSGRCFAWTARSVGRSRVTYSGGILFSPYSQGGERLGPWGVGRDGGRSGGRGRGGCALAFAFSA